MSFKEQIGNLKNSIQKFWKSQSKKRKIIALSIIALIIIGAVVLTLVLHKPAYTVLYTGLETSECSEISTQLKSMEIDAQVKEDGTILVPETVENDVRMQLATMGYPKTTFSYDIWTENVNMFTTDSKIKQINKMELQNRLAATISTLSDVNSAIVTLDIPDTNNNVLSTSTSEPRASVVLHLKTGSTLTSDQIKGITHIVSMSISGLDEENVSITDGTGTPLNAGEVKVDQVVLETQKLQFKKDFEDAIAQEILGLLTPSYGPEGVKVTVNASLDYDKNVKEQTTYTPSVGDNGMVEHEEQSQSSGTSTSGGDIVGVEPNADGTYPTSDGSETEESWSESSSSTSYLVNTLKEQTEKQGYYVDRVSVSVMVYKDILSSQERTAIENVAKNAAGTQEEYVSVENLPPYQERDDNDNDDELTPTNGMLSFLGELSLIEIILICGGIVLIIIIIVLIVAIRKHKRRKLEEQLAEQEALLRAQEEAENEVKKLSENEPETKEAAIRHEIEEFTKNSPEVAAQLLKNWLREEGN